MEGFFRLTFDDTFLILKDVHEQLNDPKVVAHLKKIAENRIKYNTNKTVFILSETLCIPKSLEHYIGVFDIPLPSKDEIEKIINNFIQEKKIKVKNDIIKEIAPYFKGLNEFQINQILKDDNFDINDKSNIQSLISKEKEQFIKKSGILEFINFPENIDDIGGLDNLKDWLLNKAKIFADIDRALEFGIVLPKGIMIIGIPGCGKSLTAKVTASLFKIPLVRLDIGCLLGKYVGESEENMRKALKLSEAISPCVLWIDEIEKAFAGVGDIGGHEVTNRLFGHLLNWIQENKQPVFIVATANDISKFPPEFLRKGRFDELFFVDLPNGEERKKIFEIHLKKPTLDKWNKEINFDSLIEPTDGFSGADLESVVKNTIERAFIENKDKITTEDLLKTIKETEPISKIHKDKIEEIRKIQSEYSIKKANSEEKPVSIKSQELTQQIASIKQEQEPIQQKQTPIIKQVEETKTQEDYIEVTLVDIGLPDLEAINRYGIKLENVNLPERFKEEERRKAEEEERRAEEETRKTFDPVKNAKVGDYIKFGNYPQSAIGTFQPIEWLVLARENNQVLVISRYGLNARRFDSSSNNWKNSEIRQWLNSEFYNKAFNEKDKRYINPFNDDNVFLLAKEEVEIYFANNNARRCNSNDYAKNNGAYVADNGYSRWWIRSPNPKYSSYVYGVDPEGVVFCDVFFSNLFGVAYDYVAVRPALWINC